jgi:hypothetical protein
LYNTEFIVTDKVINLATERAYAENKHQCAISYLFVFEDSAAVLQVRRINEEIFKAIFTEATAVNSIWRWILPRLSKRQKNLPNPSADGPFEYYSWTVCTL